jgi:ABC-type amino acid transport substrate-binding protein
MEVAGKMAQEAMLRRVRVARVLAVVLVSNCLMATLGAQEQTLPENGSLSGRREVGTLHVGLNEWPPYIIYAGNQNRGIVVDILRGLESKTGIRMIYRRLPTKRMHAYFNSGLVTVDPASNPIWRQKDAAYSCYSLPFLQVRTVVLGRQQSTINAMGPESFKGLTLGGQLGYAGYGDGFDEAFAVGAIRREDTAGGEAANLQKLLAGRVDGVLIDHLVGWYLIADLGFDASQFKELYQFKVEEYLHLRIHKTQEHLLPILDEALSQMIKAGTVKALVLDYVKTKP